MILVWKLPSRVLPSADGFAAYMNDENSAYGWKEVDQAGAPIW